MKEKLQRTTEEQKCGTTSGQHGFFIFPSFINHSFFHPQKNMSLIMDIQRYKMWRICSRQEL
jgi:hypothetical protein